VCLCGFVVIAPRVANRCLPYTVGLTHASGGRLTAPLKRKVGHPAVATEPAAFLNLDLELRCREDLTPLASYLENRTMVLYSGESGGEFRLTVEPLIGGHSNIGPDLCTGEMLATLATLPEHLLRLFQACHVRMFDYGFDGGIDEKPCSVDLPASQLAEVVRAGIAIRITVYPYRTSEGEATDA